MHVCLPTRSPNCFILQLELQLGYIPLRHNALEIDMLELGKKSMSERGRA